MLRRKVLCIFVLIFASNIPNIQGNYGYDYGPIAHTMDHLKNHEISVVFPKYNINIAPPVKNEPQVMYQEFEEHQTPQVVYQEVEEHNPTKHDPQVMYLEVEEHHPIRHEPQVIYQEVEEHHSVRHEPQVIYQEDEEHQPIRHEPQVIYQEVEEHHPIRYEPQVIYQEVEEPYNNAEYEPNVIEHKTYDNVQKHPQLYYFKSEQQQSEQRYPIITREPISSEKPCIQKFYAPSTVSQYGRNAEEYNPELGATRSNKHNTDSWFYSSPTWNTNNNNNMNILREADPRSILASHTHFVKIKKPIFGSKVIFSHQKKFIGDHDQFHGDHDHHYHGGLFNGRPNINKNTHIHVHNRNAEPVDQMQRHSSKTDDNSIIGSHLFAAPRWRRNVLDPLKREKRGLLDVSRLIVDPKSKFDFQKTSENVGSATRNVFTEDYSPLFHLTNALGSAHDSFYSLMNVRPHGFLVPCRYKVVHINDLPNVQQSSPLVGSINPAIYSLHNQTPASSSFSTAPEDADGPPMYPLGPSEDSNSPQYVDYNSGDPLHVLGDKLRESVQWAHQSATHAADTIHHVRQIFTSARKDWPKLLLPYAGALEVTKPKLEQQEEDIVGTAKDPEFVGVGKMMDYLGMTDRKPDISPRVGGPRMISEEEIILKKAKEVLGAPTYRDFLNEMKRHLDIAGRNEIVGKPRLVKPNTDLQAKLAMDKLRSALMAQKAKADLRRKQAGWPRPPSLPKAPQLKPARPLNLLKPPAKPLIKPIKTPVLKSPKPNNLKPVKPIIPPKAKPELVGSSHNTTLDKIREQLKGIKALNIITTTTPKPRSPLEKLRQKLYEKYKIPNDGTDHSDLLGKTLAVVKNPETVGARLNTGEAVPVPLLTKEMRTPFMGLATKQDLEQYFKKLYCSDCKMGDIK